MFSVIAVNLFSTTQILKKNVNDCFKINVKQMIKMANKGETVKF